MVDPDEIILVVRTGGGAVEFYKVSVEKYTKVMELVQPPRSKL
jgi:hypothetical protein